MRPIFSNVGAYSSVPKSILRYLNKSGLILSGSQWGCGCSAFLNIRPYGFGCPTVHPHRKCALKRLAQRYIANQWHTQEKDPGVLMLNPVLFYPPSPVTVYMTFKHPTRHLTIANMISNRSISAAKMFCGFPFQTKAICRQ